MQFAGTSAVFPEIPQTQRAFIGRQHTFDHGGRNPSRHRPRGNVPGWWWQTDLRQRGAEKDLDLVAVDHLPIGWLRRELDQRVAVDSLREKIRGEPDRVLPAKALAEDESRRELSQPNPL